MKCIVPFFSFFFLSPHFFFCCKHVTVIRPVASLTHLSVEPLFISTVCFIMTPVDVFFAGGGAEKAVG